MTNIQESLESRLVFSKERIKELFDSIPIPSYVWQRHDNSFFLIDYNTAAEKVTEGKVQDFLYKTASEIYDNRTDILTLFNKCYVNKKRVSKNLDYTLKTTGKYFYLRVTCYYLHPDLMIVHVKDLTSKILIENKLKNSEKQYRELFEHSPLPIVILSLDGIVKDHNLATEKQYGYTRSELIGMNYLNIAAYPSTLTPLLKSRFSSLRKGEYIKPFEIEIYKKDGTKVWILSEISTINYYDELSVIAFLLDINESKEFEKKIKWKLEIEHLLSNVSSRFIGNINIDEAINASILEMGNLIDATRAYIFLYNETESLELYAQEWCTNKVNHRLTDPIVIKPEEYPWSLNKYNEEGYLYIKNIENLPREAKKLKDNLSQLDIKSILVFPIKIKGELYGFIGFDNLNIALQWDLEDIELFRTTSEIIGHALERKWSEETLKSSHQLLAGIISSLVESICLINNEYDIIWANNASKQHFGLQLTGKKCYKVFFHRRKKCQDCIALKTFADGRIHEKEAQLQKIDGSKISVWCTSSTAGLNIEGETEYSVLIFRDITKRKQMEESLLRSERDLVLLNESLKERVIERTRELTESEEKYKRILNDLDVGFYKGVFKGELLMHNQTFNRILNLDKNLSLVGAKAQNFFLETDTQKKYYEILIKEGHIRNFKVKLKRPDGKMINVQLNSHLIRDKNGNPKEVEGTIILIDG